MDLVVFRDVIERHKIKNVFIIKFLIKSMISSFAKEFSENSESRIISDIQSGHTITYFSSKKNLIDNNFLLIRDINEITTDLNAIFTTQSTTIGTGLLNKYNAEFVLLTENAKNYIAQEGYSPVYGARPLKRVLQKQILDNLAMQLLEGGFGEGDHIVIDLEKGRVVFRKRK